MDGWSCNFASCVGGLKETPSKWRLCCVCAVFFLHTDRGGLGISFIPVWCSGTVACGMEIIGRGIPRRVDSLINDGTEPIIRSLNEAF